MPKKPTYEELEQRVNELAQAESEHKRIEKALRESEEKYRGLVEGMDEAIYRMSLPDGKYEYMSPAAKKVLGYSAEEFLENPLIIRKIIHPDFAEYFKEKWADLIEGKVPPTFKYKIIDPEGNERWIVQSNTGIFDDSGNIIAIEGLSKDITARKQAEEALRESEDKFRSFAEQSLVGIYLISGDVFKYVNPKFAEIFGYSVDECLDSMHFPQLVHPEDLATVEKQVGRRLSEETKSVRYSFRGIKKSGETIHVEIYGSSMLFKGKSVATGTMLDITDRKRAEGALRTSEERFSGMFEHSSSGVAIYESVDNGEDFVFRAFNPAAERITHISRSEVLGNRLLELFPHMDKAGLLGALQRVWKTGEEEYLPPFYYKDEIREGWRENRIYKLPTGEIVALFDDVTDQKQAEEALKESEEKYRNLVEESFDGIFIQKGPSIIFANKRLNEMLRYGDGELIGQDHWVVYHPDYQKLTRERAQARMRGEEIMPRYEVKLQRKDGSWFYGEINARPITFHSDQESGIQVWVIDITERKRAAEALRESEEKFKTLVNNLNVGVNRNTPGGKGEFIEANPAMAKMFGFESREELMAQNLSDLYMNSAGRKKFSDKLQKSGSVRNEELEMKKKDGTSVIASVSAVAVKDEKGDVRYFDNIIEDITERKALETQLQQAQKMEAIGTLTGGIAHDYNNLMSIVMGNLSMAQEEAKPGSALADFLNEANMASRKVRDLTHELMSLSRGGMPVREVGPIDEVLKNVSELIPADSAISLSESISQDLKLVSYDRHKMGAAIRNVVKNAVEAMPDGGTLKIKAENLRVEDAKQDPGFTLKPGDFVHISIRDQGKGIPEEHMGKIFDPYFSSKEMGVQKGMGLGLTTVYAIIKQHGGHIKIDSSPGAGTTVNIYLPAESQPAEADSTSPKKDDSAFPMKRLLVMDDEEMLRNLARQMLERMRYAVETVEDGLEAIEKYKKQKDSSEPFDAVILDLTIKGGMGGEQTMRELLKIDPDVKAIVSSGYFNDPVMSDFEKYGFVGALAKPYEKKALKEVLERISE